MIRTALTLFIICFAFSVQAQLPDQNIKLKPILSAPGGKFFYGGTKVRKGYGLQVPLQSLEDAEINRHYRNYKNIRLAGKLSWFVPVGFLLIGSSNNIFSTSNSETDALGWMLTGAFLTNIGCNIVSNIVLRKGIDRYNSLIFKGNSMGMKMERLPTGSPMMSWGIVHRF